MQQLTKIDSYAIQHAENRPQQYFADLMRKAFKSPQDLICEEKEIYDWTMKVLTNKIAPREAVRHFANYMRKKGHPYDAGIVLATVIGEHSCWGEWQYQMENVKRFGLNYSYDFREKMKITETEILVYKIVYLYGCNQCKRIWLHKDCTPRLYTEKFVRSQSSNYGQKAKDWRPQIGLMHPGCTDSGIALAISGVTDLTYPRIFDYGVQDHSTRFAMSKDS